MLIVNCGRARLYDGALNSQVSKSSIILCYYHLSVEVSGRKPRPLYLTR